MVDLTTSATLNGDSITVTVEWDNGGDGTADGSESVSIGGGTNTYTLSTTPSDASQYRITPEETGTAKFHSGELSSFAPAAPSNLSASASTEDQIDLSWTDNADNEDGFYVYRAQATGSTKSDYTQIAQITTANTTSYTDTSLEDGEQYFYRVTAYNSAGESNLSNEANAVTILPGPSGVSLDTSIEDEITVSWTNNDDSSDGTIEVYQSTDGTLGTQILSTTTLTTTSHTETGLNDGEEYHYTVRRSTDHATSDSSQVSGITVLPAPTSLASPSHAATSIDLSWTDNHDYGDTQVQYKPTSSSTWTTFSTLPIGTNAETVTGLRNGEEYDLRVLAHTEHTTTEDT